MVTEAEKLRPRGAKSKPEGRRLLSRLKDRQAEGRLSLASPGRSVGASSRLGKPPPGVPWA